MSDRVDRLLLSSGLNSYKECINCVGFLPEGTCRPASSSIFSSTIAAFYSHTSTICHIFPHLFFYSTFSRRSLEEKAGCLYYFVGARSFFCCTFQSVINTVSSCSVDCSFSALLIRGSIGATEGEVRPTFSKPSRNAVVQ